MRPVYPLFSFISSHQIVLGNINIRLDKIVEMSWLKRNSVAIISTTVLAYGGYKLYSYFTSQNQNNLLPALTEDETLEIIENLRDR